jgi:vancomycin resistance protein YoaR
MRTDNRELTAGYRDEQPTFTRAQIDRLGPVEVIGEFQTGGFSSDSGRNIRRAAEQLDGVVVRPGETFSLNGATNPRNAAAGYVEAGIIERGRPSRGVGGGVSQMATTLFNAAYFAGMEDVEHHEHSYYISRYPAGREATVFGDVLDVKFRNNGPTSVQIQTEWTPSSITARLVGIKRYEVTSSQSPRSRPTSPQTISIPAGEACSSSGGAPGFTITDTRTLREIATGRTETESHTVVYDPIPRVVCG